MSRRERPGRISRAEAAQRWPALKNEPVREEDVEGTSQESALAVSVLSYILAGPILFGGIAWFLDRWLDARWLIAVGVLFGLGLSIYVIWLRYGMTQSQPAGPLRAPADRKARSSE